MPCSQASAWPLGRQRRTPPASTTRRWTAPNEGAVNVAKTSGCEATAEETPRASSPAKPRCDEEVGVAAIPLRAGRTARLASVATGDEDEAWGLRPRRPPGERLLRSLPRPPPTRLPGGSARCSRRSAGSAPRPPVRRRRSGARGPPADAGDRSGDGDAGRTTGPAPSRPARGGAEAAGPGPSVSLRGRRWPGTTTPGAAESPRYPRRPVAVRPSNETAGNGDPAGACGRTGGLRAAILTRTTLVRASGSASNTEIAHSGRPVSRSCAWTRCSGVEASKSMTCSTPPTAYAPEGKTWSM